MHNEFWYFLTCALDTIPFIYFLYQPLKGHLRTPFYVTLLINYAVMTVGSLGFVFFT